MIILLNYYNFDRCYSKHGLNTTTYKTQQQLLVLCSGLAGATLTTVALVSLRSATQLLHQELPEACYAGVLGQRKHHRLALEWLRAARRNVTLLRQREASRQPLHASLRNLFLEPQVLQQSNLNTALFYSHI